MSLVASIHLSWLSIVHCDYYNWAIWKKTNQSKQTENNGLVASGDDNLQPVWCENINTIESSTLYTLGMHIFNKTWDWILKSNTDFVFRKIFG